MKKMLTQGQYLDHTTQLIAKLVGLRQIGNTTKITINPDGSVKIRSLTPKGKIADKCDIKSYRQYYGQYLKAIRDKDEATTTNSNNNASNSNSTNNNASKK